MSRSPAAEPVSACEQNAWLHRYAVFVAMCTLLLIITGALVTSSEPVSPTASQSLADSRGVSQATGDVFLVQVHRNAALPVIILTLGLAVWLLVAKKSRWLRGVVWAAMVALILEGVLGEQAVLRWLPATTNFSHAYLAQLFFSCTVAIAVFTSPAWNRSPELVEDRLSLRTMSLFVPALVLVQVALGAAYRHQAMGVLTHIFGALVVAVFVLLVGVLVVKQYPGHRSLKQAAVALMSITGLQVLLGFAAFLTRLMTNQATPPVVISTVAHVATGALTLAASVVLAIQIRRNVRAAQPDWAESSPETLPS
jgi:heme A synthase